MSALGGKADMALTCNSAYDPKRTCRADRHVANSISMEPPQTYGPRRTAELENA